MKCICGNEATRAVKKDHYEVTPEGKTVKSSSKIKFGECTECGIMRQINLPFENEKEYSEYYKKYPPVTSKYKAKTYEHDLEVAKSRCEEYGIGPGCGESILDVGSGSGAFVDECRKNGAQAYGCEIAKYDYAKSDDFIYKKAFEDVYFPTDHFSKVTCHDMIEHVIDPEKIIGELFRVTSQGGQCIIDIPNFFNDSGKHHWKQEHIWYFSEEQFKALLEKAGFVVQEIRNPIPSKSVFYCTKPSQDRPSILVPPGIGDSYWSIIKIQSFLKREGLGIADVYIASPREKRFQGHKRAAPFIEMFPFLNSTGVAYSTKNENKAIWKEAYAQEGRTIFKNVVNCDYFISYNGHLRVGWQMEQIDPDLECNWFPPMFVSIEQENYKDMAVKKYGKYILFYFVFQGTYCHWTKEFPIHEVIKSIKKITEDSGCKPIFVGAKWDAEDETLIGIKNALRAENFDFVDLVGKTSIHQLFGLIRGSELLIGYPSGLSIMSAVLKAKTLIIWNDYYNRDFAWYACPPETRGKNYFIERTANLTAEKLSNKVMKIIGGEKIEISLPASKKRKKTEIETGDIAPTTRALNKSVAIVCVLKSGGDFTQEYVEKLRNMVTRNTTIPIKFYCFTDVNIDIPGVNVVRLKNNLEGCWSKVEMFKSRTIKEERIIYFDLDTVILKNIDDILRMNNNFVALKPWNRRNLNSGMFASGLMAWENNGNYDFIYDMFRSEYINQYRAGDQEYISTSLRQRKKNYVFFQDLAKGIYSYKRNCRPIKPDNARIVCFHGKPRPAQCKDTWVQEAWK